MRTQVKIPIYIRAIWVIAAIISALYVLLSVADFVYDLIDTNFDAPTSLREISDDAATLILVAGFFLAVLKRPATGGFIIIMISIIYSLIFLSDYGEYPAGSFLMIPLLVAGVLFVTFWWKLKRL
jgi:hypothetical protein